MDDVGFLADVNHPLVIGQEANALGRYKRVFNKHQVVRKVSRAATALRDVARHRGMSEEYRQLQIVRGCLGLGAPER